MLIRVVVKLVASDCGLLMAKATHPWQSRWRATLFDVRGDNRSGYEPVGILPRKVWDCRRKRPTHKTIRRMLGLRPDLEIDVMDMQDGTLLVATPAGIPLGELRRIKAGRVQTVRADLFGVADERRKVTRPTRLSRSYRFMVTLYTFGLDRWYEVFHAGNVGIVAFNQPTPTIKQLKAVFGAQDRQIEVADDEGRILVCRKKDGYPIGELKRIAPSSST
jgi:hypothetical protein